MFLKMRRQLVTFTCPWLLIYSLFKKQTVPLGENLEDSGKRNFFIDGKHSMGNVDSPDLDISLPFVHAQENFY